jgi:PAS domain S-box-containing protein
MPPGCSKSSSGSSARPNEAPRLGDSGAPPIAKDARVSIVASHIDPQAILDALADPAQPFRALFDRAGLGLCVISVDDSSFLVTNPAYEELLGYTHDELQGTTFLDHTHPDDRGRNSELWEEHRSHGRDAYRHEKRYVRKGGGSVWVEVTSTLVRDSDGVPRFAFTLVEDISDRKAVEEELRAKNELLESLVKACPLAMIDSDLESRVTMWNKSAERIFGWKAKEVLGHPLPFVPDEGVAVSKALRERATAGEVVLDCHVSRLHKSGAPIEVSVSLAPRRDADGRVVGIVGVLADIGEHVLAKRELEQGYELLHEADEQRRTLLGELVRAQEEERRHIATEIHDDAVQEMVAVGLQLSILERSLAGEQAELVLELESAVSSAIGRLRQLLFTLRPAELDRGGLASAIRMVLHESADEMELDWRLNDRMTEEPPLALRTILFRIARGAITYAQRHAGARSIQVTLESSGAGVLVQIRDDGQGSPTGKPDSGTTRNLGLVEMRERAKLAGGWFRIDNTPEAGTTVRFWVPVWRDSAIDTPAKAVE